MYPPETSLIPATVALTNFFENNGFSAFSLNYPFWYLGTTSYKFLIGPLIPIILSTLHKIFPQLTQFTISIAFISLSFILCVIGWLILILKISDKKIKILSFSNFIFVIIFFILPWKYLAGFALDETSFTIARNFLPFVLLSYWSYLNKQSISNRIFTIITTSLLLLFNTSILPLFAVGGISLILAHSFNDGKIRRLTSNFKIAFIPLAAALVLITFYYTPLYWLTILFNPSIGGVTSLRVFIRIFDLLKSLLPVVLSIIAVSYAAKIKSKIRVFSFVWCFSFLFLTMFRFLGDPDFWQDWTAWLPEVELGILLLVNDFGISFTRIKKHALIYLLLTLLFIFPFASAYYGWSRLQKPSLINSSAPSEVESLNTLASIAKENKVFLSGSTVFWADALHDIYQVRGGRDQVAVHPTWDKASWEIREGISEDKSLEWLNKLSISYVLVHTSDSAEYYHDYKNLNKWENIGELIWNGNGDQIYRIKLITH